MEELEGGTAEKVEVGGDGGVDGSFEEKAVEVVEGGDVENVVEVQ